MESGMMFEKKYIFMERDGAMIKNTSTMAFVFLLGLVLFSGEISGQMTGREIVEKQEELHQSVSEVIDQEMRLIDKSGTEEVRRVKSYVKEQEKGVNRSLTVFLSPADVKGTAFLNYTHKVGDDDQWLYLPALKRVKRISSRNKSGSFMGSEFAYEDIASQEVEKYTYKWLRDEIYEGKECFVSERYPVDKKSSGYSRQVAWVDKQEYRTQKIEFYDRKNMHIKTLTMNKFEQYEGKFWRALDMYMVNHLTGKSTLLQFSNYKFKVGLTEADFNKNSLKRIR